MLLKSQAIKLTNVVAENLSSVQQTVAKWRKGTYVDDSPTKTLRKVELAKI